MADELMSTNDPLSTGGVPDEVVQSALDDQARVEAELSWAEKAEQAPADAPVVSTRERAETALAELYRWHDTDTRFTGRLDMIKAYIQELEEQATPMVGIAAYQPGPNLLGTDLPAGDLAEDLKNPGTIAAPADQPKGKKGK